MSFAQRALKPPFETLLTFYPLADSWASAAHNVPPPPPKPKAFFLVSFPCQRDSDDRTASVIRYRARWRGGTWCLTWSMTVGALERTEPVFGRTEAVHEGVV
ncbi:hypothetical protein ES332_A10G058300v1 [Gossypium tomentosum]|uniref:Uncharacterized protein n=1 Tax=Gossypium tomentosum TaxID=34277 RepID=A0A5D2NNT1_GOSTO|nr:hypothetical protein ES332_A10G058300v1 [Gossypium tomentosum]